MSIFKNGNKIAVDGTEFEALKQLLENEFQDKYILWDGVDTLVTTVLNRLYEMANGKANIVLASELPATTEANTQYWVETYDGHTLTDGRYILMTDSTNRLFYIDTSSVDFDEYQKKIDNNLETTSKEVVGAINELKERIDNVSVDGIPIMFNKVAGSTPNANICIFNFYKKDNSDYVRMVQEQVYNGYILNPITSNNLYGGIETTQQCVKTDHYYVLIEQVFTSENATMRFRRKGQIITPDLTFNPYTDITSATVSWSAWKPVDYPSTQISSSIPDVRYNIKGGICYLAVLGSFTPSGSGEIGSLFTLPSAIRPPMEVHGQVQNSYGQTAGAIQTIWVGTNGVVNCWATGYNWQNNIRGNLIFPIAY